MRHVICEDFELGGLPKESIVRPDNVFALNEALIVQRLPSKQCFYIVS